MAFDRRAELSYEDRVLLWVPRHRCHEIGGPILYLVVSGLVVEQCFTCQIRRQAPLEVSLILWNVPSEPWSRLHIDQAGPFKGSKWLVIVDVIRNGSTLPLCEARQRTPLSNAVVACSHVSVFPDTLYLTTDRNSSLTNLNNNGIVHIRTTPYHSRTNDFAEKAVQIFKERMNKAGHAIDFDFYSLFFIRSALQAINQALRSPLR
ncbi:Uncharacterized protein T10_4772 [Trichinella papuae]|uniref:Integrase catalytic domain-containing protein n=1 Tax=Trichinella papuae TaxID=268474 RepID=A0A0V1M031_9BILA|nr:Uncharacterized protein T10_4772 [Trichinella papuae]